MSSGERTSFRVEFGIRDIAGEQVVRLGKTWTRYDVLGGDLLWRTGEFVHLCMERYISRMLETLNFSETETKFEESPSFDEKAVLAAMEKQPDISWPLKKAIGMVQWCATVCRPDVSCPVQALARRLSAKGTKRALVNVTKKVVRFLASTKLYTGWNTIGKENGGSIARTWSCCPTKRFLCLTSPNFRTRPGHVVPTIPGAAT